MSENSHAEAGKSEKKPKDDHDEVEKKQIAMAVFIVLRHRRDAFRAQAIWISARPKGINLNISKQF